MKEVQKICKQCQCQFSTTDIRPGRRLFCSPECKIKYNNVFSVCLNCEKELITPNSRANDSRGKFCSKECRNKYAEDKKIEMTCKYCKKTFKYRNGTHKFCSQDCFKKYKKNNIKDRNDHCIVCNKIFIKESNGHICCSIQCGGEYRRNKILCKCDRCGKEFYQKLCSYKNNLNNFCSKKCNGDYKRKQFNEHFFEEETPEVAYWAGFLMADGNVYPKINHSDILRLKLSEQDKNHLLNYKRTLNIHSAVQEYSSTEIDSIITSRAYSIAISSPLLRDSLPKWGITPRKTYTGQIPEINEKLTSHYIRGLIDGDGSIFINKQNTYMVSLVGNKNICEWVKNNILKLLNINFLIYLASKNTKTGHETYKIRLTKRNDVIRFLDWMYKGSTETTRLDRKYQKYLDMLAGKKHI